MALQGVCQEDGVCVLIVAQARSDMLLDSIEHIYWVNACGNKHILAVSGQSGLSDLLIRD
jgi:hypothetical protein